MDLRSLSRVYVYSLSCYSPSLAATLIEALNEFDKDEFIREALGQHVCAKYIEAKKREWEEYSEQVSEWEIRQYLNKI